jgi:hypothetical protein
MLQICLLQKYILVYTKIRDKIAFWPTQTLLCQIIYVALDTKPLLIFEMGITLLLSFFYGCISLVSVVGNSTVIFIGREYHITTPFTQSVGAFF